MTFDYTSIGFFTFDCLGRPVNSIPPGGDTYFIDEMALAVSGAASVEASAAGSVTASVAGLAAAASSAGWVEASELLVGLASVSWALASC